MAVLVFEGHLKTLETIKKENRLRVSRGIKATLTDEKAIEVKEPKVVKSDKPKAKKK